MVLQPADLDGLSAQHTAQQVLEGLGSAEASAATEDPALTPRAWWKSNKERTIFTGIEDAIMVIRDMLKQRKFDVCSFFPLRVFEFWTSLTFAGCSWVQVKLRVSSTFCTSLFFIVKVLRLQLS